jgi:Leucine Rich Repeat (LRR) protein
MCSQRSATKLRSVIVDPCNGAGWEAVDTASSCRPFRALTLPRRELHFPAEFSLGRLYLRGPGRRRASRTARHGWGAGWREFREARGHVWVPAGNQLKLEAWHPWPDPAALEHLGPLDLQALILGGRAATEPVLGSLAHLSGLELLDLWTGRVGDDAIPFVTRLQRLRVLDLWGTGVTDAGLQALSPLGGLRHLTVPRRTSDAAMACLGELDGLRELDLSGSAVTDAGLGLLAGAGAHSLTALTLWDTHVTDAALCHLQELPSLVELDLGATAITDQGLADLAVLPLRWLSLRDTLVSVEGLQALREALPGCRVDPSETQGCTWRPPAAGRFA